MRLRIIAAAAAAALVLLAGAAWILLNPSWAVQAAQQQVEQIFGRSLAVRGGASLSFSPLAVRLEGLSVSSPQNQDESVLTARAAVIPVSLGALLSRRLETSGVTLEGAEFAMLIDERGRTSWDLGAPSSPSFGVTLRESSLRYFDARNGQSLTVGGLNGRLAGDQEGGVSFNGTADAGGRLARVDATLKSLARVQSGGSPLDLAIQTESGSATFSGRLSTEKVLSLAGPLSLVSRDAAEALRWAGLPLELTATLPLNIDGALDSAGRAFAIRDAALTLGSFRAAGRIVFDLRGTVPKLQADVTAPAIDVGVLLPASGAKDGDWGTSRLSLGPLKRFDAEIAMKMDQVSYGGVTAGASQALVTLTGGKLDAALAARASDGGVISVRSTIDSTLAPPQATLDLKAENTDAAPVLTALTGQAWLNGKGTLSATLMSSGFTQQDMAGTLSGTASLALADGAISGFDMAALLPAVSQRILEGWSAVPGQTPFTALTASASIADGIATLTGLALDSPALKLTATGEVDLLRRAVDARITPQTAAAEPGAFTALPYAIAVKGPWSQPRIYPDIDGILANPEAGFAKLKDIGLRAGN